MDFGDGTAHLDGLDIPHKFRREVDRPNKSEECMFWVSHRDNMFRCNLFAVLQHNALTCERVYLYTFYFCIQTNLATKSFDRICQRFTNFSNTTFHTDMSHPTAISPVVHESIACPCAHRSKRE